MYNPQTRRVHLVSNGHCVIVNQMGLDYPTNIDYPGVHVLKSIDCKLEAKNESTSLIILSSEFRLVRDDNSMSKVALRFISPKDGYEWTIYVRANVLIVAEKIQQQVDGLREPCLEVVNNYTPYELITY